MCWGTSVTKAKQSQNQVTPGNFEWRLTLFGQSSSSHKCSYLVVTFLTIEENRYSSPNNLILSPLVTIDLCLKDNYETQYKKVLLIFY